MSEQWPSHSSAGAVGGTAAHNKDAEMRKCPLFSRVANSRELWRNSGSEEPTNNYLQVCPDS